MEKSVQERQCVVNMAKIKLLYLVLITQHNATMQPGSVFYMLVLPPTQLLFLNTGQPCVRKVLVSTKGGEGILLVLWVNIWRSPIGSTTVQLGAG